MIAGLIGKKLGHSFSKTIHEQLTDYTYHLIELSEEQFHDFMTKKSFDAINVTIPYKEKVIPYCDEIDSQAARIHAVNAIKKVNGKLIATNTDYDGLKKMIERHFDLKDRVVAICGSGGTSKTALAVCQDLQAKKIYQVARNRTSPFISYEEIKQHEDIEFILNTTSVGMSPDLMTQILDLNDFKNCQGVIDVVYNPLRTSLTLQAREMNLPYVNGLEMLVGQAVRAVEFFTNQTLDEHIIPKLTHEIFKSKENLVLIGMPGCGKSTLGKKISEALDMDFIDLDEEIEKRAKKSIPLIFKEDGETSFRKMESEILLEAALSTHTVISCGGGVIKNEMNMKALQLNGFLVCLKRELNQLDTSNRPLSSSIEALKQMEKERQPLYQKYSDIMIENNDSLENVCEHLQEVWHEHTCA